MNNSDDVFGKLVVYGSKQGKTWVELMFSGIDWAEDNGMNRGDIVKREENVIYGRFKTVKF